jgi:hypothetical protein
MVKDTFSHNRRFVMNGTNMNFPFPFSSVGVWVAGAICLAIISILHIVRPPGRIIQRVVGWLFFLAAFVLYIALRTETFRNIGDDVGVLLLALAGVLSLTTPSRPLIEK